VHEEFTPFVNSTSQSVPTSAVSQAYFFGALDFEILSDFAMDNQNNRSLELLGELRVNT